MSTNTKFRILFGITVVSLTALILQSAYLWQLDRKLVTAQALDASLPPGVEERLEAALTQQGPVSDPFNPFASSFSSGGSISADPFASIRQMQQRMDSLFNGFAAPQLGAGNSVTFSSSSPSVELQETDEEYLVIIQTGDGQDLELSTELEDSRLTVNGLVKTSHNSNLNGFASNIVSQSQFSRSFHLPAEVDELGILTEQNEDGVVIRVPKKAS